MTRTLTLAGAFLATLVVILGAAAVGGLVADDGFDGPPEIEIDHYLEEDLVHDRTPGEADVQMDADVEQQTIVIDPGIDPQGSTPRNPLLFLGFGGPDVTERDISPLVNALVAEGHEVRVYTPPQDQRAPPAPPGAAEQQLSPIGEELADADAFVTFRRDYDDDAVEDIQTFREEDGRVLFATDPDDEFDEPGAATLESALGVTNEPGYVYNLEENDLNYQRIYAESAGDGELTEGVDRAMFETATPVRSAAADGGVFAPIEGSQLSTTRAGTDAPVVVRNGGVVMVGDTDFLTPENAQRADNDVLIGNLADFLVTNDRDADEQPPEQPEDGTGERPAGPTPPEPPEEEENESTEPTPTESAG